MGLVIKVFCMIGFVVLNMDTGEPEMRIYQKEMSSMEECQAFIRQDQFTSNVLAGFPEARDAVGVVYDCLETEVDKEI